MAFVSPAPVGSSGFGVCFGVLQAFQKNILWEAFLRAIGYFVFLALLNDLNGLFEVYDFLSQDLLVNGLLFVLCSLRKTIKCNMHGIPMTLLSPQCCQVLGIQIHANSPVCRVLSTPGIPKLA